jgi:hypothetical protein
MSVTQNPSQQAEVVNQVVKQLQLAMPVTVEQRFAEPIVKPTTAPETTAVD